MKTKFTTRPMLLLVSLILFAFGCKKGDDDPGKIGVCPEVLSTTPANLATDVVLNSKVIVRFNEAMNPASFNSTSYIVKQGANVIAGTISYADTSAMFSPAADLLPLTVYTVTMKAGVKDPSQNTMIDDYTWSFTTGKLIDVIAPTVVTTDPANAAVDVAVAKVIAVNFSEEMDVASLQTNILVTNTTAGGTAVNGVISYSGTTAYFTPTVALTNNNQYTVTITTGAKDLPGNALAANFSSSFTTIAIPDLPPTVTLTNPSNLATLVEPNAVISATFNEDVNGSTVTLSSFTLTAGGVPVTGTVATTGSISTFTPANNLLFNTQYTATLTTAIKDLGGNNLISAHSWTFTTKPPIVVAPPVGTLINFGVFGGTAGITNQGINTIINGGGIATTAESTLITGFHDGLTQAIYTETTLNIGNVTGGIYTAPPMPGDATSFAKATQGLADANDAYISISPAARPGGIDPGAGELGGLTLTSGVYKSAGGSFNITNGDLTLDAKGDANAVFIFQAPTSLTVGIAGPAGAMSVLLINGAQAKNVFWWVGSAATINGAGGGVMSGTIISSAGVTLSTAGNTVQTVLNGKAISLVGSVTMVNTTINVQ
ncbi:Ig-like domain-containing protein [Flavitalea antarctica]